MLSQLHIVHPLQVLYDLGVVSTKEPFGRLVSQGMILGEVEYSVHRVRAAAPVNSDFTVNVCLCTSCRCLQGEYDHAYAARRA